MSFEGREDFALTAKLLTELPGILNWCLDGLKRLRDRGRFIDLPESQDAKRRMLLLSEPVRGLIDRSCVVKQGARIDIDVLYREYEVYCGENGIKHVLAKNKFSEFLMSSYPQIKHSRRPKAGKGGGFVQVYSGVCLKPERALVVYRHDKELVDLYSERSLRTILLDTSGAPVPLITLPRPRPCVTSMMATAF